MTTPVKLPPGRERLTVRPVAIGSTTAATMGIDLVASWSAAAISLPSVRITSGPRRMASRMGPLKSICPSRENRSTLIFTARADDGEAVGHVEISQIWPHLSSRLSRILVAPDKRRRGIALSMVAQALFRTFDGHRVDRVDLGVSANNAAAISRYKKLGFAQVGLWPKAIVAGSHGIDVVWMTMTRDRWNDTCDGKQGSAQAESI